MGGRTFVGRPGRGDVGETLDGSGGIDEVVVEPEDFRPGTDPRQVDVLPVL